MSSRSKSNYEKHPVVPVVGAEGACDVGWEAIISRLKQAIRPGRFVVCVECYPGCFEAEIERELIRALKPSVVLSTAGCFLPEKAILELCEHDLGDDPVFAFMNHYEISDFLDSSRLSSSRTKLEAVTGLTLVIGTGATLIAVKPDLLVYCDMARWEIQKRQRAGTIANLGLSNRDERPALKYKRAYFVDWRAADRLKKTLLTNIDFLLDTNAADAPKMIS